jgi:hypothetical protein
MFSSLRLITFARGASASARDALVAELREAARRTGASSTLLAPTCAGVWNGGDLIWRSEYAGEDACRAAVPALDDPARVARVEHVACARGALGGRSPRRGLYRVALFCANRNPDAERLARFAGETSAMPRRIAAIRRWQLATPVEASGSRAWTHVWEQEYDDLAGLSGPYMLHPCHWSEVDRWFDPEEPDWLIDPLLCHSFCETDAPVIGAQG